MTTQTDKQDIDALTTWIGDALDTRYEEDGGLTPQDAADLRLARGHIKKALQILTGASKAEIDRALDELRQ